jgi:hypothetical protein
LQQIGVYAMTEIFIFTETEIEILTTEQAVLSIIKSQDPDLVYISTDSINWQYRWKHDDPRKSDWTNYDDLFCLDEISILTALESCIKQDTELLNDVTAYVQQEMELTPLTGSCLSEVSL